jgi:hypothetical protein
MGLRKRGGSHQPKPRWGSISELDKRVHVGTETFKALPRRLQHLSAWRRMNSLGHMPVRMYGTRVQIRPSSDIPLKMKVKYVKDKIDG